ncbi:MAG: DUF6265 family protein [Pseudomonadota bacterium]
MLQKTRRRGFLPALLLAGAGLVGCASAEGPAKPSAAATPTLADVAFLQGAWRGGDEFVFAEIWSPPMGGVMTGMALGAAREDLKVLEYIIISETEDGLVMQFKHFNADYSTWEENGPVTLRLTETGANDVTFSADPPSETVKSIRYFTPSDGALQADIVLLEDGEEGGFSLSFSRDD